MIYVDLNDFTLGEIEEIENTAGVGFTDLLDARSGLPMAALVWIAKRREEPSFTLEQAKGVKLSEVTFKNPREEDTDRPTDGGDSGSSSSSPSSSDGHLRKLAG